MSKERILELLAVERECIIRATWCDRDCINCTLIQTDTDLLEMYNIVIDFIKEHMESNGKM